MNYKVNIISNYASQIYITALGILVVPFYIKHMGPEAYGLIAFFSTMLTWFNLLDVGLTPTISRETARFNGGGITAYEFRNLAKVLELLFFLVATIGGISLYFLSDWLAVNWLKPSSLTRHEIINSLELISLSVSMRWLSGYYKGIINGYEKFIWLGVYNSLIATMRFVLIMPIIIFYDKSPTCFFSYQLAIAAIEVLGLLIYSYKLIPPYKKNTCITFGWSHLKPVLKFSISIAFTSSIWVLVTQTDKLILSKILPLSDYGYFSVAVLLASGISIMSSPIANAAMPRMVRLHAEGKHRELITVYRKSTQLMTIITVPVTLLLVLFPKQILFAWTGSELLQEKAASVLTLYSAGYGILAFSAFPYFLQYAKGNLRLHVVGNLLFLLFLIPSIIYGTTHFGVIGAGFVWFLANTIYFLCWVPLVHNAIVPKLHLAWITKDIFSPTKYSLPAALTAAYFMPLSTDRWELAFQLSLTGIALFAIGLVHFRHNTQHGDINGK